MVTPCKISALGNHRQEGYHRLQARQVARATHKILSQEKRNRGEEEKRGSESRGVGSALQLGKHGLSHPFFRSGLCTQPSTQQPTQAVFACSLFFFNAELPRGRCDATGSPPRIALRLGLSARHQARAVFPASSIVTVSIRSFILQVFLDSDVFPPAAQQALLISVKGKPVSFFQIIIV